MKIVLAEVVDLLSARHRQQAKALRLELTKNLRTMFEPPTRSLQLRMAQNKVARLTRNRPHSVYDLIRDAFDFNSRQMREIVTPVTGELLTAARQGLKNAQEHRNKIREIAAQAKAPVEPFVKASGAQRAVLWAEEKVEFFEEYV